MVTNERRKVKHELQRTIRKHLSTRFKSGATTEQMHSAAKHIANVVLSGKDPRIIQQLDGKLVRL